MDQLTEKKRYFRSLLPMAGIVNTIEELKAFLLESSEKSETLILIESHIREVRKKQQIGVIDFDSLTREESKTRNRIINLIADIEKKRYNTIFN